MPTQTHIEMPYGQGGIDFDVPSANLLGVWAPRAMPPAPDAQAEIERALAHPIGGPTLADLAHQARRVVIVADDNTRPTPTQIIMPVLLNALNCAGVPDSAIQVVIALGTHRKMDQNEITAKFGDEVVCRVPVVNHDAFDPGALMDLGKTPGGVEVQLNRTVMEADLVLGIGSIVPHHIPGFSGGAKIIQPGVCGEKTTGQVHLLSVRHDHSLLGVVENVVRREMEAIAARAGLRAILNTVLDREGRVVGAVYGDPHAAFRQGVALSRQVYGVVVPGLADIIVAGSHPCDVEFWQAHKALYAAELCVRRGGTIIVVTPCPEGVAVTHPDMIHFAGRTKPEIEAAIQTGEIHDLTAGALALAWANTRQRAHIALVSHGITSHEAQMLGFRPFATIEQALGDAMARHGREARVGVLPYAPDTLPILNDETL